MRVYFLVSVINHVLVCAIFLCLFHSDPLLLFGMFRGQNGGSEKMGGWIFGFSTIKSFYREIENWPQRANKNHIFTQQF